MPRVYLHSYEFDVLISLMEQNMKTFAQAGMGPFHQDLLAKLRKAKKHRRIVRS